MADEKINVKITTDYDDDDAKKAIKDAEKIEKLDPELEISADNSAATADINEVADASGRLSKDDTVIVIKAQIDAAKADLDALETKLHDVDDAATATGNRIGTEVEGGTDKAKAATHSMAGNVIGDSAAMATGFGPLGEALGQITEGALGGEIALKSLLTAGLGLGAITLVVGAIQKGLAANKAIDAFNKKKVDDFTEALKTAHGELDILNTALRKDDKIEFIDAGSGQTKDLTESLANAHITWDTFLTQISKGEDSFRNWVIAMGPAIGAGEDLNSIIQAGHQFLIDRAAAQKLYDDQLFVSGQVTTETDRETRRLNAAYVDGSAALEDLKTDSKNTTIQIDKFKESTAAADLAYRRLTGTLDEQEAWATVNQAIADYSANTNQSEEDTRNLIRSIADYVITTDTIPPEKKTEILADLNEGDIAAAELALTNLTRQRDIKILLTAVGSKDTIKLLTGGGRGGTGILVESDAVAATGASFAAAPQTLNVNLPRGARHSDIARALNISARRSGSRYANPVVHYANR